MSEKTRICSRCNVRYDDSLFSCPNCFKANPKYPFLIVFWIFICLVSAYIIFHFNDLIQYGQSLKDNISVEIVEQDNVSLQEPEENVLDKIEIRPMTEFSYHSVEDILNQRKEYVNASIIFGNQDYEPSPEVFQIEDNLPWISAEQITKYGVDNNSTIWKGPSRHSLSINNPELLIVFLMNDYSKGRESFYASEADYMLPYEVLWDKVNNLIKVKFNISLFFKRNVFFSSILVQLEDANARDLGYKWAYCDKYENVKFENQDENLSTDVYELQGFYHKGFACGLESGCNNYSPNQPALQLSLFGKGFMRIKLWKEKPASKDDQPDLIYEMYLE